MAKKKLFLHVGPEPRALTHADLSQHRALLAGAGCLVPEIAQPALDAAATEMLRNHRARGLSRREVEGAWAGITRGLWRLDADMAIAQPQFAEADVDQFALILDHLAGLDVHVMLLLRADEVGTIPAWSRLLPAPRLHVREIEEGAAPIDLAEALTGVVWAVRREDEQGRTSRLRAITQRRRTLPAA
ncbi:hypothetical protein [Nocardioides daejeonensis]|uniref:hypothetical protein n=1 Tax=Nocardioides daejeonensis TaxID=1046556 RepID=UPI000D74F3B8|nr:hypothetical protein [Nocardioides daejeonensis]